jgi:predicted Zn finger-like uncharacterized protein
MPGGFVTQCPGCQAKLKLKETARGKKIRCPKCSTLFSAAASHAAAPARAGDVDEFGELGEGLASLDPFDQPMPTRTLPGRVKTRRAGSKSERPGAESSAPTAAAAAAKKDAAGEGSNKTVLVIVGVLALCLLLGVGGFAYMLVSRGSGFLSKLGGRSGEGIAAKYLPNAPEVVICIRVADIFASRAGKEALGEEEFKKPIELFSKAVGLHPEDIDTVTLAIAASANMRGPKSAAGLSQLQGMSGEDSKSQTRCIVIVRAKKPIDREAFAATFKMPHFGEQPEATSTTFSGFRVFRRMESSMVAFPDPTTMLLGSVVTVEEVLADPSPSVPELQEIEPKQNVILAVLPHNWPKQENLIRRRDDGPTGSLIRAAAGRLFGEFKLSCVGLTFGKDVRLRMSVSATRTHPLTTDKKRSPQTSMRHARRASTKRKCRTPRQRASPSAPSNRISIR